MVVIPSRRYTLVVNVDNLFRIIFSQKLPVRFPVPNNCFSAVVNLPEKLSVAYIMSCQFKSVNGKNSELYFNFTKSFDSVNLSSYFSASLGPMVSGSTLGFWTVRCKKKTKLN